MRYILHRNVCIGHHCFCCSRVWHTFKKVCHEQKLEEKCFQSWTVRRTRRLCFCPYFLSSSSFPFSPSNLKYSVTVCEGSGQTQEAKLIGSTWVSMGMCDQSLLPRAFPSLHLLCVCVSNRSSPRHSPVSTHLLTIASCQMC